MRERFINQIDINSGHIDSNMAEFASFLRSDSQKLFLNSLYEKINDDRSDLTPLHFGLLVFGDYRYSLATNLGISRLSELDNWEEAVELTDKNAFYRTVELIVLNKSVNITSPYRYGALTYAITELYGDTNIDVLDIGGGFYPLGVGSLSPEYLPSAQDDYTGRIKSKLDNNSLLFRRVTTVDIQEPDPLWTAACVWTPIKEIPELTKNLHEKLIASDSKIDFVLGDICVDSWIPSREYDVCWMANVSYQLNPEKYSQAMGNINSSLKLGGWLLVADYEKGGSKRRPFTYELTG